MFFTDRLLKGIDVRFNFTAVKLNFSSIKNSFIEKNKICIEIKYKKCSLLRLLSLRK
ncbi:hypothetical protein CCAN2_50031 [Capnocytophaga canimorsus]|nr:hypothetical protein CCAN2_50031 [Capnocytophaga canimorsus]